MFVRIRRILNLSLFMVGISPTLLYAEHSWNNYHWARTTNPFTLQTIDSMTNDWDMELLTAQSRWSVSLVIDLEINLAESNDSKGTRKRCNAVDGQMRVCNAAYGNNGWLGLASIYVDNNGHIVKGTAKMNDSYASYWNEHPNEKNHVACQEIGHVLGLTHTSEDGTYDHTCMDYSQPPDNFDSRFPNPHDYDELASVYAHTDSYNTFVDAPTGDGGDGGGGVCNSPPGKGCNKFGVGSNGAVPPMGVRVNKGPRFEIWVAPGKDGSFWMHHVTLLPDGF